MRIWYSLIIISAIIVVFFNACKSDIGEEPMLWISKYMYYDTIAKKKHIKVWSRDIFSFKEDSLIIKHFYFDFYTDNNDVIAHKFYEKEKFSIVDFGGKYDTAFYDIKIDSIEVGGSSHEAILVFKPMEKFKAIENDSLFHEYLTSSTFEVFDSVRIEFNDSLGTITPNWKYHFGDNGLWMVDHYENETFLVFNGLSGYVLHLKSIDNKGFTGLLHGYKDKEIRFNKLQHKVNFETDYLIGEWIEYADVPPPLPPPIIEDPSVEFFYDEHLVITDSTIFLKVFHKRDTARWYSNREQDLLLLYGDEFEKWKIISLSENEMELERRGRKYISRTLSDRKKFRKRK